MADIKKVIIGLEHCADRRFCNDICPYSDIIRDQNRGMDECVSALAKDALELLKEYQKTVHCKDCKWSWCLNPNDESPFYVCRHPTLCNMRMSHKGNWYCGNGELKDGAQE